MTEIVKRITKNRNRQHAIGRGLQLSGAGCRACHHKFALIFFGTFIMKLGSMITEYTNIKILKKRGQHIAEYAILITVISVALTVMYVYMKRGLQAVIKQQVDAEIGPQIDSAPMLDDRELQDSISRSDVIGQDASRVQVSSTGATRYISGSVTNATGNTTINSGQIFMP